MASIAALIFGLIIGAFAIFYLLTPYDYNVSTGLDLGMTQDAHTLFGVMLVIAAFFGIFAGVSVRSG